jgi:hypothetical protein
MAEAAKNSGSRPSAFSGRGMAKTLSALSEEIRELYLCDAVPWVVGYSGGKDSSATLGGCVGGPIPGEDARSGSRAGTAHHPSQAYA